MLFNRKEWNLNREYRVPTEMRGFCFVSWEKTGNMTEHVRIWVRLPVGLFLSDTLLKHMNIVFVSSVVNAGAAVRTG